MSFLPLPPCKLLRKLLSSFIVFSLSLSLVFPLNLIYAQDLITLPEPEAVEAISKVFTPTLIKGVKVDTENPFKFDFIVDTGDTNITGNALKAESTQLIKYFLASLTTPEDEAWVNLSPYEKDKIISQGFGKTMMGRDLLAQDYILKQLSASISNPQKDLGQEFWTRVHKKAFDQYGTTDIPLNTFNKIWIVPEDALVYQKDNTAFVVKSHLKVYLEEDYIALQKSEGIENYGLEGIENSDAEVISGVTSQVIKDILIPEIEKEVNQGSTFANLRQIYNSVILATWYKNTLKNSILSKVYVNQNKVNGVNIEDESVNQEIYEKYVSAFKKGVYNFIQEEYDETTQELIPRKYFSGGLRATIASNQLDVTKDLSRAIKENDDFSMATFKGNPKHQFDIEVNALALNGNPQVQGLDQAPFVQSSKLEDFAMSSRGVKVGIPNNFSTVLEKGHDLLVDNIEVVRVNGSGGEKAFLNDPLAKYMLESSSSAAIGSYYLRGLGKKTRKGVSIKNAGDANALRFIEEETMAFVKSNPEYAVVELASEGLRDGSVSTPVGRIQSANLSGGYIDTATFEFDEKGKGFIKSFDKELYIQTLKKLRDLGVQILYKVTDSLEKTEGLVNPEARNNPTDSWALNSFILDQGDGEHFRLPIDDNFRTAGYSYHAPKKADIGPLDMPSVALPKIAAANGLVKGTPKYNEFMNNVTVVMLGPRGFELKDEDSSDSRHAHFLADAIRFKEINGYDGMRVDPVTDGDLMPRLMSLSGPNDINDHRNIITLGRSGSAEAEAARAWAKTYEGAHMVSRRVSTKATANKVAYETADNYTDEEKETNTKLGYADYSLTKVSNDEEEEVQTIVSMTSVTGATDHLGRNFRDTMQSVQHDTESNTITTSTLINDTEGNLFIAKVTYRPKRGKLSDVVESVLAFNKDSRAVLQELGINRLNADSATMKEAVNKGILTPEETSMYTQIPSNEIPPALSQNFERHGLTMEDMFVAEVDAENARLQPTTYKNIFTNTPTVAGISVSSLQALAGSAYSGTLNQLMGRATEAEGRKYGTEIDAAAVKVGRDSLETIARRLDIVIIIGGNEGGFRDDSADMPIGLVINPNGQNGKYMYFGDSVEVTNGVKREIGRPGTSSMISLVPYKMMPSTDGYRTSFAIDKFNPNKPYPVIDPVVTKENSLRHIIGQLADYLDMEEDALIADLAENYELSALDRIKNEEMFAQAEELGISTVMREDGDPIFMIRALQGIPSQNGKKLLAISTGGANEHIMAMIFASLYKKGYMSTVYTSTTSLKEGEKQAKAAGIQGNLDLARKFVEKDMKNFQEVDKALDRVRAAGFDVPKSPVTVDEVKNLILLPDSPEISALRRTDTQSSLVFSYNTGANNLDWSNLSQHIQPVTWRENEDGSGRVKIGGFFINNEGKVVFYKASLTTENVTHSRYSIIERNDLMPNPLITEYNKTRVKFQEMIEKNESDIEIIQEHANNIKRLLGAEEEAKDLLSELDSAVEAAEQSIVVDAFVLESFDEIEKYILGNPTVKMEDGTEYSIVQKSEDFALSTNPTKTLTQEKSYGGINLNPELINMEIKRDGKGIILPIEEQPYFNAEIDGLLPVIINVTPVNIPLMLGLETEEKAEELASL